MAYRKKKKKVLKKLKIIGSLGVLLALLILYKTSSTDQEILTKGLNAGSLKTALHEQIRVHTYLDFDQNTTSRFWWDNYFKKTDWNPDKYYWDMYSNSKHNKYKGGKVQNREHCVPRSWWAKRDSYSSFDANGDLHNIFPADYTANSAKSNLPLGEVGISVFDNGVSKVGSNTFPKGYRGQVFEPADEYKGDFARTYFYMITCYQDYANNWRQEALKSMFEKNTYPGLQPWAIEMLLKWHRNDPVSEKEKQRNNNVYKIQGNRNPFIDNPELVEYIWGDKINEHYPTNINYSKKANSFSYIKDQLFSKLKNYL